MKCMHTAMTMHAHECRQQLHASLDSYVTLITRESLCEVTVVADQLRFVFGDDAADSQQFSLQKLWQAAECMEEKEKMVAGLFKKLMESVVLQLLKRRGSDFVTLRVHRSHLSLSVSTTATKKKEVAKSHESNIPSGESPSFTTDAQSFLLDQCHLDRCFKTLDFFHHHILLQIPFPLDFVDEFLRMFVKEVVNPCLPTEQGELNNFRRIVGAKLLEFERHLVEIKFTPSIPLLFVAESNFMLIFSYRCL